MSSEPPRHSTGFAARPGADPAQGRYSFRSRECRAAQHGGMQSFAACRIQHGQQPSASAVQQDTVHIRPVRAVSVMCLTASYFFLHKGCSPSASAAAQLFSHYSYRVSIFIWIIPPCTEIARKIYPQIAPVP